MTLDLTPPKPERSLLAGAAITLAAFALCVTAYSALLLKTHSVDEAPGLGALISGLALAALAIVCGVLALGAIWRSGRKGGVRAFFALVLGAAILAGPAYKIAKTRAATSMDDVATNPADPPRFDYLKRNVSSGELPLPAARITPEQAVRQRSAYPAIATLRLSLAPNDVTSLALTLIEGRGWKIVGRTSYPRGGPLTGRIEAVSQSVVLGLKDDISIRIRPDGSGSEVDMRSSSRVRHVDFGANAERITSFLADLTAAANAAP